MPPCKGCESDDVNEGETYCDVCQEENEILAEDFIKYETCAGGCRPMCEHDPAL